MDVVFHDDLMRLRTGSGPANMATIRHAALNIVKQIPDKASLKVRRKTSAGTTTISSPLTQPPNELKRFPWPGVRADARGCGFGPAREGVGGPRL